VGAEYRIQVINLDAQKEQVINIDVDDRRRFDKTKEDLYKGSGLKSIDPDRFKL
jgi:hypothetical protein